MSRRTFDVLDDITLTGGFSDGPRPLTPAEDEIFLETGVLPAGFTAEDLASVDATVRKPRNLGTVTPSITHIGTGRYQTTVTPAVDEWGKWWYAFHGTGAKQARREREFVVRKSQVI